MSNRAGAIKFATVTGGLAVEFNRIDNLDVQGEPKRTRQRGSGNVVADILTVDEVNPQFKFDVKDIEAMMGLLCHPYGNTVGDVDVFLRNVAAVGPSTIASITHKNYDVPSGFVYWTNINLSSKQDAAVNVVVDTIFDPEGAELVPFTVIEGVAFPAVTGGSKIFTLGMSKLNGVMLSRVQSVMIANEFQFEADDDIDRGVFKERTIINDSATTIRVKLKERVNWTDSGFGFNGSALNGTTGFTVFARRKNFAESATEHVKIVAPTGNVFPINAAGQGAQLMVDEFVVECTLPSNGIVLTFTSGQAIS